MARCLPGANVGSPGGSGEGSPGSPDCSLAPSGTALPAQHFPPRPPEGGSAQPIGRREGPAAEEEAPPPAPLAAPPPPPLRAHLRGSHKGAGLPAHGGADKGAAEPAALFVLPEPGPRLSGHLASPNRPPARPGPREARRAPRWGTPKPHAHTDAWTHPNIHIHSSISTHGPPHFTHMYAHADTREPSSVCLGSHPTSLTLVYRNPLAPSCGHRGTSTHGCSGTPPGHVCPHSHPCTLTQDITHRQAFPSALPSAHRPCASRHTQAGRPALG